MTNKTIDFNIPLLNLHGEPMEDVKTKRGEVVLDANNKPVFETLYLKNMIANSLLARQESDAKAKPTEILQRTKLAQYIISRSTGKYSKDDLETIEECVIKSAANHILTLRVQELIHGNLNPPQPKEGK